MRYFSISTRLCVFVFLFISPLKTLAYQAEPYANTVSKYDLSVKILPESHHVEVAGTLRLPATEKNTNQIEFYLSPKMQNLSVQFLEPKITDASVSLTSEDAGGDTKWTVKTTQQINARQSVLLHVSYVSETEPAPQFNISPEGSFAGGGGELWYPQTAFSNREIGTLRFFVPVGETVVSNGTLESSQRQRANGEYVYNVKAPSKFGFASGKYTVLQRAGKVSFTLYLLRPRENSQAILDGCAKALDFLVKMLGRASFRSACVAPM